MSSSNDILNAELGQRDRGVRNLIVQNIEVIDVKVQKEKTSQKAVFTCKTERDGREIRIGEAWTRTRKGDEKVQGLWINLDDNGNLISDSVLGRLLQKYEVSKLRDLIGQKVKGYPDNNKYTILSTFDLQEEKIDQIISKFDKKFNNEIQNNDDTIL